MLKNKNMYISAWNMSDKITMDLWNWWPVHFFSCGQFWITELNLLPYDHSNYKYQYSKRHCSQLCLLTEIFEPNPWFKKIYHHNPCLVSIIGTFMIKLFNQSPLMKIYQIPIYVLPNNYETLDKCMTVLQFGRIHLNQWE